MTTNRVIAVHPNASAATRATGLSYYVLNSALTGKSESAGGYKWRYGAPSATAQYVFPTSSSSSRGAAGAGAGAGAGDEGDDEKDQEEEEEKEREKDKWKEKLPDPNKMKEYRNGGKLRDYQIEGLTWLLRCWYSKRCSILADEMGLGKVRGSAVSPPAPLPHLHPPSCHILADEMGLGKV